MASEFDEVLDFLSRLGGQGSSVSSIFEQIRGINGLGTNPTMPVDTDQFGLLFFTRPRLNLSHGNLQAYRPFTPMMGRNVANALPLAVRVMLDPKATWAGTPPVRSPLVDDKQAFIPWLTNGAVSMSGWPDMLLGTFDSKEGNFHESWSMVDDTPRMYRGWEASATFRNGIGDIILLLFWAWVSYEGLIYEGTFYPYPEAIIEHEIDYYTRIYRLVLDSTRRRVVKMYSTLGYPRSVPIGMSANYSIDSPTAIEGNQHTFQFKCVGMEYFDEIILQEFNDTVCGFNKSMLDSRRNAECVLLKPNEWALFNYHTYFRINPDTYEFERWVDKEYYRQLTVYQQRGLAAMLPGVKIPSMYLSESERLARIQSPNTTPTT